GCSRPPRNPRCRRRSERAAGLFKMNVKPSALGKAALAVVIVCAVVAAVIALAGAPSGSAESHSSNAPLPPAPVVHQASPGATASSPPPAADPTVLASWTVREDPASRGLALGWQRGSFSGAHVTVPHVMRARSYSGHTGSRNYEGSVAWFKTSFRAP